MRFFSKLISVAASVAVLSGVSCVPHSQLKSDSLLSPVIEKQQNSNNINSNNNNNNINANSAVATVENYKTNSFLKVTSENNSHINKLKNEIKNDDSKNNIKNVYNDNYNKDAMINDNYQLNNNNNNNVINNEVLIDYTTYKNTESESVNKTPAASGESLVEGTYTGLSRGYVNVPIRGCTATSPTKGPNSINRVLDGDLRTSWVSDHIATKSYVELQCTFDAQNIHMVEVYVEQFPAAMLTVAAVCYRNGLKQGEHLASSTTRGTQTGDVYQFRFPNLYCDTIIYQASGSKTWYGVSEVRVYRETFWSNNGGDVVGVKHFRRLDSSNVVVQYPSWTVDLEGILSNGDLKQMNTNGLGNQWAKWDLQLTSSHRIDMIGILTDDGSSSWNVADFNGGSYEYFVNGAKVGDALPTQKTQAMFFEQSLTVGIVEGSKITISTPSRRPDLVIGQIMAYTNVDGTYSLIQDQKPRTPQGGNYKRVDMNSYSNHIGGYSKFWGCKIRSERTSAVIDTNTNQLLLTDDLGVFTSTVTAGDWKKPGLYGCPNQIPILTAGACPRYPDATSEASFPAHVPHKFDSGSTGWNLRVAGWNPGGYYSWSGDWKAISVTGGGDCGYIMPTSFYNTCPAGRDAYDFATKDSHTATLQITNA